MRSTNILNIHSVPGTLLGADDTVVNKTSKVTAPIELTVSGGSEAIVYFMKCDEFIVGDMSGVAQTAPRFSDSLEGLAYSRAHGYDLLQQKDTERSQLGDKMRGEKSGGNQAQTSNAPFPVESARTPLFPPTTSATTHVKGCLSGRLIREPVPRASAEGWARRHHLPGTCPNSTYPEGKR